MRRSTRRRIVFVLAFGALGYWSWILASGGIVRRPPRKLDRPAVGVTALSAANGPVASVASPSRTRTAASSRANGAASPADDAANSRARIASDPTARLAEVEVALAQLDEPLPAGRFEGLDDLASAWGSTTEPRAKPAGDGEPELARWMRDHALAGTHVRGSLRIAVLGERVVREGDTLDGALVRRIDRGSIEIEWNGAPHTLLFAAQDTPFDEKTRANDENTPAQTDHTTGGGAR